jgi:hypothetical protein
LKIEATRFSETSVHLYQIACHYFLEDLYFSKQLTDFDFLVQKDINGSFKNRTLQLQQVVSAEEYA